jgi:hypothetical protein
VYLHWAFALPFILFIPKILFYSDIFVPLFIIDYFCHCALFLYWKCFPGILIHLASQLTAYKYNICAWFWFSIGFSKAYRNNNRELGIFRTNFYAHQGVQILRIYVAAVLANWEHYSKTKRYESWFQWRGFMKKTIMQNSHAPVS